MWKLISKYEANGVAGVAFRSNGAKIQKLYSVGVFFASCESRNLTASSLLPAESCQLSIVVRFKESDDEGLRNKYDPVLLNQVKQCTKGRVIQITGFSIRDVDAVVQKIISTIPSSKTLPESTWFIDFSSVPMPYFLGILGWLRKRGASPRITLFNSTGNYEKAAKNKNEAFSFTEGSEKYMWVPWLWGCIDPTLPWLYVFLLGFEGERSVEIYDRFEPQDVHAIIGRPGFMNNYTRIALERNKNFLETSKPSKTFIDAGDAVKTWEKIHQLIAKNPRKNICLVPLGTKPHALGAGLAALANGACSVLYLLPKSFRTKDIPRGKYVWRYEITL